MRTRLLVLLASVALCAGPALVAVPLTQANAAGTEFEYKVYTMCADDPDGRLCVESVKRNGIDTTVDYPDGLGPTEWLYVDNGWRNGIFSFNINTITRTSPGAVPVATKDVDLNATWEVTVDTGSYAPRELNLKGRNVEFTKGGSAATGFWFKLKFNPVPIAWRWSDETGPYGCDMTYCGTSETVAEFVSGPGKGVADGYVSDLGDSDAPRYVFARTGFFLASNAQYQQEPEYDPETNSILVQMANPHLRSADPDVAATGFFEAFLPDSYLIHVLGVPYPETLTSSKFTVTRLGVAGLADYTATHTGSGLAIKVHDIGFSRPKYRLAPKPSAPGKPRLTGVKKVPGAAVSSFLPPLADGGRNVDAYQARCQKAGGTWHYKIGTKSPITVSSLPAGTVYCQVRAHNAIGWGLWGKAAASRV